MNFELSIHLAYLRWHAALLPLIFMAFRFLDSIMRYRRSKCVTDWNEFERTSF
jgi:hypothetical protein